MKVYVGVDAGSGYVHTIVGTLVNMHDISVHQKCCGKMIMQRCLGASGCPEIRDDEALSKIEPRISKRPSSLKKADNYQGVNCDKKLEHDKPLYAVRYNIHFSWSKIRWVVRKLPIKGLINHELIQCAVCQCQPCNV